jgi:hypothetical protein
MTMTESARYKRFIRGRSSKDPRQTNSAQCGKDSMPLNSNALNMVLLNIMTVLEKQEQDLPTAAVLILPVLCLICDDEVQTPVVLSATSIGRTILLESSAPKLTILNHGNRSMAGPTELGKWLLV